MVKVGEMRQTLSTFVNTFPLIGQQTIGTLLINNIVSAKLSCMSRKPARLTIYRDLVNGQIVAKGYADNHLKMTEKERVRMTKKGK
jgi:hypothetical protein